MSKRIELLSNVVLTLAAVLVAGIVVRRELLGNSAESEHDNARPQYISDWRTMLNDGLRLGREDAPLQVAVFTDFECPYCAKWHLDTHRPEDPDVALTIIHVPFKKFSMQAAVAVECASTLGRADSFVSAVYSKQDSIGLRRWEDFARDAELADIVAFDECLAQPAPPHVAKGKLWATRIGIGSTPRFVVNGWLLPFTPSREELDDMLLNVKKGVAPVAGQERTRR